MPTKACPIPRVLPLGYVRLVRDGVTMYEPDPSTAPFIREAFELLALRTTSLRSVLEIMAAKGLRNRNGRHLSLSSFQYVVTNPVYCGLGFSHGVHKTGLPAMVSPVLFAKVQERLKERWH